MYRLNNLQKYTAYETLQKVACITRCQFEWSDALIDNLINAVYSSKTTILHDIYRREKTGRFTLPCTDAALDGINGALNPTEDDEDTRDKDDARWTRPSRETALLLDLGPHRFSPINGETGAVSSFSEGWIWTGAYRLMGCGWWTSFWRSWRISSFSRSW